MIVHHPSSSFNLIVIVEALSSSLLTLLSLHPIFAQIVEELTNILQVFGRKKSKDIQMIIQQYINLTGMAFDSSLCIKKAPKLILLLFLAFPAIEFASKRLLISVFRPLLFH